MRYVFKFVGYERRVRLEVDLDLDQPIEALKEAARLADWLVTQPTYLCDWTRAGVRVTSADATISMWFSIAALIEPPSRVALAIPVVCEVAPDTVVSDEIVNARAHLLAVIFCGGETEKPGLRRA